MEERAGSGRWGGGGYQLVNTTTIASLPTTIALNPNDFGLRDLPSTSS